MTDAEKEQILDRAQNWFRGLATQHINNIETISSLDDFQYNPFLIGHLSQFFGDTPSPENLARVLLYPRALGPSINTLFGNAVKTIGTSILGQNNIGLDGTDISFVDQVTNTTKYAVIKSGPMTINQGDAQPLIETLNQILASPQAVQQGITKDQLVVVIVYGERERMHGAYLTIETQYRVLIGQEFWHAITGDGNFYSDLIDAIAEIVSEIDGVDILQQRIALLAADPALIALSTRLGGQG